MHSAIRRALALFCAQPMGRRINYAEHSLATIRIPYAPAMLFPAKKHGALSTKTLRNQNFIPRSKDVVTTVRMVARLLKVSIVLQRN
jgi:hypothetical protein